MRVHLVTFEAWNITRYVFVSNKRREIAGASELITHLDERWVDRALEQLFPGFHPSWQIEQYPAELLATGAASVKVLVRERERGTGLVRAVTTAALRRAPGLDVFGFVSEPFDWSEDGSLAVTLAAAAPDSDAVRRARLSRPGPDERFLRLPIVDECATTGLPASVEVSLGGDVETRSVESHAKRAAYGSQAGGVGLDRLAQLAGIDPDRLRTVTAYLQDDADWVAVVYADGNGLGGVFSNFSKLVAGASNRAYASTLRSFTTALDACARDALLAALAEVHGVKGGDAPVLPLIVGGDDVVFACDGAIALPLAEAFLRAYERLTADPGRGLVEPLERASLGGGLSASAGVAIVKTHYPFEAAARLAYELLKEAKEVKAHLGPGHSGLSFHVLHDHTDARLTRLRTPETSLGEPHRISAQPYIVGDVDHPWAAGRRWSDLERQVTAIIAEEDGERMLPATQLHRLRVAVRRAPGAAEDALALIRPRYPEPLAKLFGLAGNPYWRDTDGQLVTGLLDAVEAAAFWGDQP